MAIISLVVVFMKLNGVLDMKAFYCVGLQKRSVLPFLTEALGHYPVGYVVPAGFVSRKRNFKSLAERERWRRI